MRRGTSGVCVCVALLRLGGYGVTTNRTTITTTTRVAMTILRPFMGKKLRSKVKVVKQEDLLDYIEPDQLPVQVCGVVVVL